MSYTRECETAAGKAREELPEDLRHAFEVYGDATAVSETERLRASLQELGFFADVTQAEPVPVLSGPGSFRYFRIAGILLLVA